MQFPMRAALLAGAALLMAPPAGAAPVTLGEAVQRALAAAPDLQASSAGIDAARAEQTQARVRPNPALSVEAENIAGTGNFSLFEQSETTVSYAQPIERGGKREARMAYAARGVALAEAQARVTRLDLAQQVQRAFIDVQIADQLLWIAEQRLTRERAMQKEAVRRVRGYKDPLFVETRANARIVEAELALQEAQAKRAAARALLASFWAGSPDDLEIDEGIEQPAPNGASLAAADAAVYGAAVERARAQVVVEQSRGVQDYTVSGGARFLRETNDVALVAGVSIPLGRFDRNQGNIERARAERQRIEHQAEADRLARLRRLAALRADASAAQARADGIMAQVYPKAVQALAQVREGYNRGGFRFSDVQDAADAIIATQDQWADAMTRYRDAQSEIDRLTGRFDAVPAAETQP
ncbi:outer membrane protein, cobalt-zinc-cadmium efflux system [Sphingomonas laterariae]|uniref:Outer membrane protein, cobalt-zinc-cadmium efflux system n=1 Tax=Edaphosphingomonas laterariae TaxID=861865 RepID=A0A239FZ61_9SPHN|nr:TolC family protein [Sphingomonas laterariae]SNS62327.1 outer membrane protein, cobalt-zinc-cadmium efflux system [Sphingomonas laterariae]